MSQRVDILGVEGDGPGSLSARGRSTLERATFVAAGRRVLDHLALDGPETFALANNLNELADRLRQRGPQERCVVLAAGDPLLFGIGHFLCESLGLEQVVIEPAVTTVQRAFTRAGVSWAEAVVSDITGTPKPDDLRRLLGRSPIGMFLQDGAGPAAVASFFLDHDLDDYQAWVAENLGTGFESLTPCTMTELAEREFGDLNVLILRRLEGAPTASREPVGIPDDRFAQADVGPVPLLPADLRALIIRRFRGVPNGPVWDIGAGVGGMAVELARTFPERDVVAIERSDEPLIYLRANRLRLCAYNLRLVAGEAPDCLAGEESPAAVFIGGTGGRTAELLDQLLPRIVPSGVLVAAVARLEDLSCCVERLRAAGWAPEVSQVQISRARTESGFTAFAPLPQAWLVSAARPTAPAPNVDQAGVADNDA